MAGIAVAADGNVYFTEYGTSKLGRLPLGFGPNAVPVEVAVPGNPGYLIAAPDHNIYFTEINGSKIGRIAEGFGSTTSFVESGSTSGTQTHGLTVDKSGNIWFTVYSNGKVDEIAKGFAAGTTPTEHSLPSGSEPAEIALGSDTALYVTEFGTGNIARITTAGSISQIAPLTPNSAPFGIAAGVDGNLWFTEIAANNIGKILIKAPAFNTLSPVRLQSPSSAGELPSLSVDLAPALPTGNSSLANLSPNIIALVSTPSTPIESRIDFWTDQHLAESQLQGETGLYAETLGREHASSWPLHPGPRMAFWLEPDLSYFDLAVMLSDNILPAYLAQ